MARSCVGWRELPSATAVVSSRGTCSQLRIRPKSKTSFEFPLSEREGGRTMGALSDRACGETISIARKLDHLAESGNLIA